MKITLGHNQTTGFNKIPVLARQLGSSALGVFERVIEWLAAKNRGERIALLALAVCLPFLVFYNLGINPRPWQDEGAALQLARTLAEDGVYAMRNSEGYQTFGPVQSVGPTLIVPVALIFRLFGVGLVQGRVVAAIFTLLALLLFFLVGQRLFDRRTAILGLLFLLAAPGVRILIYGREVVGEVPALAFLLASWLALARALQSHHPGWTGLAGLLFGATIITKSQYLIMIPATLGLVAILDLVYYRQQAWKTLGLVILLALSCGFAWHVWQVMYFGLETYQANLALLSQLASATTSFDPATIFDDVSFILGTESGNFYLYWGIPAMGYAFLQAARHSLKGLLMASLAIFTSLWLLYFMVWVIPWPQYAMPGMALVALFVARLYSELWRVVGPTIREYSRRLPVSGPQPVTFVLALGTLLSLFSYGLWVSFTFQKHVRQDVIDRSAYYIVDRPSPPQLQNPVLAADYLKQNIPAGAVIETWERELSILTDLTFHFPDQSMLVFAHNALNHGGQANYLMGEEYFRNAEVDYLVLGWFARLFPVYDQEYLEQNSELIFTIGQGNYNYEIYRLNR